MFRRVINRIIDCILYGGYNVKGNGIDQIRVGNYKIRISLARVESKSGILILQWEGKPPTSVGRMNSLING